MIVNSIKFTGCNRESSGKSLRTSWEGRIRRAGDARSGSEMLEERGRASPFNKDSAPVEDSGLFANDLSKVRDRGVSVCDERGRKKEREGGITLNQ